MLAQAGRARPVRLPDQSFPTTETHAHLARAPQAAGPPRPPRCSGTPRQPAARPRARRRRPLAQLPPRRAPAPARPAQHEGLPRRRRFVHLPSPGKQLGSRVHSAARARQPSATRIAQARGCMQTPGPTPSTPLHLPIQPRTGIHARPIAPSASGRAVRGQGRARGRPRAWRRPRARQPAAAARPASAGR